MTDDLTSIYQAAVLEHSRNPHHFGSLDSATHQAEGFNPLCGDKCTVYLQVDDNVISGASHETAGCAICQSSASMMSDALQGIAIKDAEKLGDKVMNMLSSEHNGAGPGMPLQALEGVRAYTSRIKCATLPWRTLSAALQGEANTSTE